MEQTLRVLLVEDDPAEAFLLQESLMQVPKPPSVTHADTLGRALQSLGENPIDAVLLDLALPDSFGIVTLEKMNAAAGHLPIIVLTGLADEEVAVEAVRKGAQDYLIKGQTGARQLMQTILRAIERKRLERELALSAHRNMLLAEISTKVAAQKEEEGLLQTVADSARALTSALIACSGAGYENGRFRWCKTSRSQEALGTTVHEVSRDSAIYLDPDMQPGVVRLTDEELCNHAHWWQLPGFHGAPDGFIGARLIDAHGKASGSIIVGGKEGGGKFTPEDECLLSQLALIASLALQHIESRKAAEAASIAKTQFLANMSHELRTPMNAILGMTDLALAEDLPPKVQEYLQTARESADVLLDILNEILDLSRIEAGRLELEETAFNLHKAVEQVIKTLRLKAGEKGLALIYNLPPQVPELVIGDPLRFRQVLINLVDNAIKFTHEGKIAVRADVRERDADSVTLEFSVSDTGIGIRPEDQERIFNPFTQVDASTTRNYTGTGLGLTISRKLVELMNGELRVESLPDQGSTFYFTVKLKIPRLTPMEFGKSNGLSASSLRGRALQILLAEDTPTNQKVAQYLLTKRGHIVEIARNGRQAVEMLNRRDYDVVLMDVQMPVMDGLQAARAIRAMEDPEKARVPIIAMTAHALKEDAERCIAAGMDAYISKPIQAEEFIELVELLGGPEPGDGEKATTTDDEKPEDNQHAMRAKACGGEPLGEDSNLLFDAAEAVKKCFGKKEFFVEMAGAYPAEAEACVISMREALRRGDRETLKTEAHRLKNTVVYLGSRLLMDAIVALEDAAASADLTALDTALQRLEICSRSLGQVLADHLAQGEDPSR